MNNFETLITFITNISDFPVLLSILPVIFIGFLYFFGKISTANKWEYHLDNKYLPFLHGYLVINNFVFIPIITLFLIFNLKLLFSWIGVLILLLFLFNYLIRTILKSLLKWAVKPFFEIEEVVYETRSIFDWIPEIFRSWKHYLGWSLMRKTLPIIGFLISYFILTNTSHKGILFIVIYVNLFNLIFFTINNTLLDNKKRVNLYVKNKPINSVRIIEFLNDGNLLKYQTSKGVIEIIPLDIITKIEIIEPNKIVKRGK